MVQSSNSRLDEMANRGQAAKRLRVLHIVGGLQLGGGEKLTALVAAGLDREHFDVRVINLGIPGPYDDFLRSHGVDVTDIGIPVRPRLRDAGRVLRGLGRLVQILFQKPRWDIVHTHMVVTALLCAIPARLAGSRLFGTMHRIAYRWQPLVERVLSPLHEAIVVDSLAVGKILQAATHINPDRYVVIYNGIDVGEFAAAPSKGEARAILGLGGEYVVITEIAHLTPTKGQDHLIAAFARLTDTSVRLLLVGEGLTRKSLERQAQDLGVADRVTFAGLRRDLPTLLAACDILALPSMYEGFGIVQAEAMYMGLPVVGTNYGGATDVVADGVTGFLVPFGDEAALTDRLGRLTSSSTLRQQFGEAGRARVLERFTQEAMLMRYASLYEGRIKRGLEAENTKPR
jgi:glycosyltransferase involved in cell wall biosynthesis